MKHADFVQEFKNQTEKMAGIVHDKGHDYSGTIDIFSNFELYKMAGITPEQGILSRIIDKVSRIGNLINKKGKVKNESIEDTLLDLSNYALILKIYLENKYKVREEKCCNDQ